MKSFMTLIPIILLLSYPTVFSADAYVDSGCTTGDCVHQPCQQCEIKKYCTPEWETKKDKKSCFYTECKEICIPKVRFPWEKCCTPKCGKVITVKLLKKHKYECEKCVAKWNIFSCNNSCDEGCDEGGCYDASAIPSTPTFDSSPSFPAPPSPAPAYLPELTVPQPAPAVLMPKLNVLPGRTILRTPAKARSWRRTIR